MVCGMDLELASWHIYMLKTACILLIKWTRLASDNSICSDHVDMAGWWYTLCVALSTQSMFDELFGNPSYSSCSAECYYEHYGTMIIQFSTIINCPCHCNY